MTYVLMSWHTFEVFLRSWWTFWCHDVFLTSWCNFEVMTYFLTYFFDIYDMRFDLLAYFSYFCYVFTYFLTLWHNFWHHDVLSILIDAVTYFLRSWCTEHLKCKISKPKFWFSIIIVDLLLSYPLTNMNQHIKYWK